MNGTGVDVGAVFARRQYGAKVRLQVAIYCVDADANLWGYTLEDTKRNPIARSVQPRVGVPGITFDRMVEQLNLLLGVELQNRPGRGLIRADHELSVAVRTLESSSEIGFRSDAL